MRRVLYTRLDGIVDYFFPGQSAHRSPGILIDKRQIEQFRPYLGPPCPSNLLFSDSIQEILDQKVPNCCSIFLPVQRDTGALRFYVRPPTRYSAFQQKRPSETSVVP